MKLALVKLIWERANHRCEYCQIAVRDNPDLAFEIDHIIARKHRGQTRVGNLCLACYACNNHKGPNISGLDPLTGKITPLFNPRRHKWGKHFRWVGPTLTGLTPIGRATVIVLEINLTYRQDLRQSLIEEGVFPPL